MQLSDFDFELPPELIAQEPTEQRTDSRLMILDRSSSRIEHERFAVLGQYLQPGDLLVLNDTRVIPARLLGRKETGGRVEIFLTERLSDDATVWECLARSSRPLKAGMVLRFDEKLTGEIESGAVSPKHRIRFFCEGDAAVHLDRIGHVPLPPYIEREDAPFDRERYQTVFARKEGALAAPTAGLHFTDEFLTQLDGLGIEIRYITLHVGLGTFLPVRSENISEHRMHEERFQVAPETADAINRTRERGRRIVAVGTTVARTLESAWDDETGSVAGGEGKTGIFIYPGYSFRVIDALLTNFHLPRSSLLMLVSAFAGHSFMIDAYLQAVEERYRFYSYGDCMLIH